MVDWEMTNPDDGGLECLHARRFGKGHSRLQHTRMKFGFQLVDFEVGIAYIGLDGRLLERGSVGGEVG